MNQNERLEPTPPTPPMVVNGRVVSRRTLIGAGAAVAGMVSMPLPASADAFSGSYPPSPSGEGAATGGAPVWSLTNDGLGTYIDVMWSTTGNAAFTQTYGGEGTTLRSGNPVLFSFTIHLNGVLLAYGTALGSFGMETWTGPNGTTAGWISGTPTLPNGSYDDAGWRDYPYTGSLDIYVVDAAGNRWKAENWLGSEGYKTPVQY